MIRASMLLLVLHQMIASAQIFYIVNGLDESLGWVNYQTGQHVAQAVTLGNIPNDVVVSEASVFVVNSGYGTVQEIDRRTLHTLREISVSGAVNPWAAALLPNARLAVSASVSGTLSVIDLTSGSVEITLHAGVGTQAVVVYDDTLFVLNTGVNFPEFGPGVLKRYSVQNLALIDSVVLGINPQGMVKIGSELHVACTGNYTNVAGSIYIVNLASMNVETVLDVGGMPASLSAHGEYVYVAAGGWGGSGQVFRYNATTREVQNDASNPILCGVGATDIEALPGGLFAVTCFGEAALEIRSGGGELIASYPMSAGPGALTMLWETSNLSPPSAPVQKEFRVLTAFPNPFNSAVTFATETIIAGSGTIDVYDALGRNVAELAISEGQSFVQWVPGVAGREEVSAGAYFARLRQEGSITPIRIVYVK